MKHFSKYWLPVILYMGIIFFLSSLSAPPPPLGAITSYNLELFAKHMIEFGILGFLMFRALNNSKNIKIKNTALLLAIVFTIIYGITDEFHQLFVSGRVFSGYDMLANSIGACFLIIKKVFKKKEMIK